MNPNDLQQFIQQILSQGLGKGMPSGPTPPTPGAQNSQMVQGITQADAPWPSQSNLPQPPNVPQTSALDGLGPQLPPAHQTFIQRFLQALRGQHAGMGTGSQSSAPLQAQLGSGGIMGQARDAMSGSTAAQPNQSGSSSGGFNLSSMSPQQLQALVKILLQRGQVQ